jgi:hypothetical protein
VSLLDIRDPDRSNNRDSETLRRPGGQRP